MANKHILLKLAVCAALAMPAVLTAQTIPLAYTPVDAQYSTALDRIVMVSANPNELHIYNPTSQSDVVVGLPKPPNAVSVSPDGLYAAVAHDALISYVNLSLESIQQTFPIPVTATSIVLSESWIYVLSSSQGNTLSVEISTGAVTENNNYYSAVGGRLNAAVNAIYGAGSGSPGSLTEYNISAGPIGSSKNAPYFDTFSICGPIWFSPDGSEIYTGCGTVFHSSTNAALDMLYETSFAGTSNIGALAQSTPLSMVAAVQNPNFYQANDGIVMLFDSQYLQPLGQFVLPGFTSGCISVTAHGKWVFFNNAGADLFVLMQGENSSGTASGFAIQTFSTAAPVSCGASFAASSATVIAAGSLSTVGVTAAAACIYQAASNSSWLQIVSGGYGSGNGTLTYIARPNTSAVQRVATISMSGQTVTVTQAGAPATPSAFQQLAYNVVAAAYDNALDKIVLVASGPNELHIYDPVSQADTVVPLALVPLSVTVRPDGQYAAVGHYGWVSYVNLQTAAVENLFAVNTDAASVVLAGNGYLYVFPAIDLSLYSFLIATQTQTALPLGFYQTGPGRLYTDDLSIYQNSGFGEFAKWNIASGLLTNVTLSSPPSSCGNLWIAADGLSIFTECGTVYSASENEAQDLQYEGTLSNSGYINWSAESVPLQTTAVIPQSNYNSQANDTEVQVYGEAFLGYVGSMALPEFMVGGTAYAGHGKSVFWNSAGTNLYVLEEADSTAKLLSGFAVDSISPSPSSSGCTFTLGSSSANESAGLGFDSVAVTTGATCVWLATSNAPWLTITAGAFSFGSGNVSFSFTENSATVARTGTITIAGQTFTVTQAAANVAVSITSSPAGASIIVAGTGCSPATYTTPASLSWSAMGVCSVGFTDPQMIGGVAYEFQSSTVSGSATSHTNPLAVTSSGATLAINAAFNAVSGTGPGTATHFSVTAPSTATAGIPVQFTVTALNAGNQTATGYTDPVHFSSTDPSATLPGDATLSNGVGTFSASLVTTGTATVTASDLLTSSIAGTSGSIAVSQSTSGLRFISIQPCRVVDTRDATKPAGFGPPFVAGGTSRSFAIPDGPCTGIPATAQAYSLNVTVVPHGGLAYLTVWPTGESQPLVSTLNSLDGDIQANAAIIPAGSGGAISVFATNDTDVVLDIDGYFVPNTVSNGLGFYPMTPCRLVDTRPGAPSSIITGELAGGSTTTLPILSGTCSVPSTAQAYSLNFTLVPPGPVAYLTVFPTGESLPVVSTLNDSSGTITANAALAPAGAGGSINVFVTNPTNLVVDINGYFAPVAEGALSLYALPPCRVLDTRDPTGAQPFAGQINVNVLGSGCGGTSAAQAYVFNATVVPDGPLGYLTLWPEGSPQPVVSTLNALDEAITSNLAIVPTNNTQISAFADSSTYLVLDLFGYFAP